MKTLLCTILTCFFISLHLLVLAGDGTQDSPYRIFYMGNSNTYMWGWYPKDIDMSEDPALPRLVKEMGENAPTPIYMDYDFQMGGGGNAQGHWENGGKEIIDTGNYDFVVLQDHSTATFAYPDDFEKYSTKFDSLCDANGSKLILFMGWPDDDEWGFRRDVIVNSYDSIANQLDCDLAPAGRAWEIIEDISPELDLYQDDDHHPNELGVYLNTCVTYSVITNTPPVQHNNYSYLMHWVKPKTEDFNSLQYAAWKACMNRLDAIDEITLSGTIANERHIQLSWKNTESATTDLYAIYQNDQIISYTSDTTYEITSPKPLVNYNIAVIGTNSDTVQVSNSNGLMYNLPDIDPPQVPENLKIHSQGTNYVYVKWDIALDNGEIKEYIVYLDDKEYDRSDINLIYIAGLDDNSTYSIEVVAVDQADNTSAKSEPISVTFGNSNSINQAEQKFSLSVYPNPSKKKLNINASRKMQTINLRDITGKKIITLNCDCQNINIDVSNLSKGIYFLKIIFADQYRKTCKILIQ